MANSEIRTSMKEAHVSYWQIGDVLGLHENTVMRRLRHELSDEERRRFIAAIEEVKGCSEQAKEKPSE